MEQISQVVDKVISHFQSNGAGAFSMSFVEGRAPKDPQAWQSDFLSLYMALIDLPFKVDREVLAQRVSSVQPNAPKVEFDAVADELVAVAYENLEATLASLRLERAVFPWRTQSTYLPA